MTDSHDNRPDLPGLESVKTNARGMLVAYIVLGLFVVIGVGMLGGAVYGIFEGFYAHRWPGAQARLVAIGASGLIALILVAWGLLRTDFFFQTDREGMTVRGIRRRRYILWSAITSVGMRRRSLGEWLLVMATDKETIRLSTSYGANHVLTASIWQHLRRFGKADDALLSEDARSLWIAIPDDIPREMDWHNPKPPDWSLGAAMVMVVLVAAAAWHFRDYIFHSRNVPVFFHVLWPAAAGALGKLGGRLFTASRCSVRTDHFEARTAIGSVSLDWSQIGSAGWRRDFMWLRGSGMRSTVHIPYALADEESVRLVLAIVRRLRTCEQLPPVLIPEPLRSSKWLRPARPTIDIPEAVELRYPAAIRVLFLAVGLMLAALMIEVTLIGSLPTGLRVGMCIWMGMTVVGMWARLAGRLRADSQGVTRRMMFRTTCVRWEQVAAYVVKPSKMAVGLVTHILKDSAGRTLMIIPPFGSKEDQEKLIAILDARLASVRRDE